RAEPGCRGESEASVWRPVDRANAVPRPAKPARQTEDPWAVRARRGAQASSPATRSRSPDLREPDRRQEPDLGDPRVPSREIAGRVEHDPDPGVIESGIVARACAPTRLRDDAVAGAEEDLGRAGGVGVVPAGGDLLEVIVLPMLPEDLPPGDIERDDHLPPLGRNARQQGVARARDGGDRRRGPVKGQRRWSE